MNTELRDALEIIGKEKNIPKEALCSAIENALLTACKNNFGTADNCVVRIDPESYEYSITQYKTVTENVENPATDISLADARMIKSDADLGDQVGISIDSQKFGRIATQNAKGVIVQKIREEERNSLYRDFFENEHRVMTGVVQRFFARNVSVNLGKADGILAESEQIKGEVLKPNQRVKVYVLEVKNNPRGPRISVSRTHPELVKCLFEQEVSEVRDGVVEIMAIAREAGSRTKMAVLSHDENVDPIGACVGVNGTRVNSVVEELGGEKIDIINWDDNAAYLIENALSPAKIICVVADEDAKEAIVIVPDYQLSLAIGKEGQNARLAAKLTGYKIDIKSESQAAESGLLEELGMDPSAMGEYTEEGNGEYTEDGAEEYIEEAGDGEYIEDSAEYDEASEADDNAVEADDVPEAAADGADEQ